MSHVLWLMPIAAAVGTFLLGCWLRRWMSGLAAAIVVAGLTFAVLSMVGFGARDITEDLTSEEFARLVPEVVLTAGYVGSASCQECHQEEHATWHQSYHRSITQLPSEDAIVPPFDAKPIKNGGMTFTLSKKQETFWMKFIDPDERKHSNGRSNVLIDRPVALITGSHYQQIFWYPTGIPRALGQLPLYYLKEVDEWAPPGSTILATPSNELHSATGDWNANCLRCHATLGRPRPTPEGEIDTQVVEFGVSCEACHGPGEKHVAIRKASRNQSTDVVDDPIINPAKLNHRRSSEVCGICHSYNVSRTADMGREEKQEGLLFRPGQDFLKTNRLIRPTEDNLLDIRRADANPDEYFSQRFWLDGMVRTGGHEFNGLSESMCFKKGELSCLTCHEMHQHTDDDRPAMEWANKQLNRATISGKACDKCHEPTKYAATSHTHHQADSTGSQCVNCHMPHTDYGLLHVQRSHQISVPNVESELRTGRPTACSLCHLDQPLSFVANSLNEWYKHSIPELDARQKSVAEGVRIALMGDAGQRVLIAASLGWKPAQDVAGHDWTPPIFAQLMLDPFDAVRFVTKRALKTRPGFEEITFAWSGSQETLNSAAKDVLKRWRAETTPAKRVRPEVLLGPDGKFNDAEMSQMLRLRNKKPIELAE